MRFNRKSRTADFAESCRTSLLSEALRSDRSLLPEFAIHGEDQRVSYKTLSKREHFVTSGNESWPLGTFAPTIGQTNLD